MATPRLLLKLHEKLGDEAMTELATLFGDIGADARAEFLELRQSNARLEARMESGFASLRQEVADVNTDLSQRIADVSADLGQRIADVNTDLSRRIADVNAELSRRIADVHADLIKWTFLFWIGTIGLVLLLLRFPG